MIQPTAVPAQTKYQPTFSLTNVTGTTIDYAWETMPGNLPKTNGNTAFLWQTSAQQVPSAAPIQSQAVGSDNEDGSDQFGSLQVTEEAYLVAYAVGGEVANIVMLAMVPAGADVASQTVVPDVTITFVGSTSISFSYAMPPGTQPGADGDWVGIWQGVGESALYASPPMGMQPIAGGSPSGNGAFTGIQVLRGTQYTIGYFKGGWDPKKPTQTTLACSTSVGN